MNDLINKVGGIKQAEEIILKAPNHSYANIYCLKEYSYWDGDGIECEDCINLNHLKIAIADHDRTDFCNNFENGLSPSTTVINLE